MKIAISTDNWQIATRDNIMSEEGIKQLEEAALITIKIAANLRMYLEEKELPSKER